MTFEEELYNVRTEGFKEGFMEGFIKSFIESFKKGRKEMIEKTAFAFDLFREGKSDEEVFQTGRFYSIEQVTKLRTMWKGIKESGQ